MRKVFSKSIFHAIRLEALKNIQDESRNLDDFKIILGYVTTIIAFLNLKRSTGSMSSILVLTKFII